MPRAVFVDFLRLLCYNKKGDNTLIPLYDNEDSVCGILYNNVPIVFADKQGELLLALHTPNGKFDGLYEHLLLLKLKEENNTIRVIGDQLWYRRF